MRSDNMGPDDTTPMQKAEALICLSQGLKSFDHVAGEMEMTLRHAEAVMDEVRRQIKATELALMGLMGLEAVQRDMDGLMEAQKRAAATVRAWYGQMQYEIKDAVAVLGSESLERWDRLRREGKL